MKYLINALLIIVLSSLNLVDSIASEKAVQHLDLPDVTSYEEATQVFAETTSQLQEKNKLDAAELNDIHLITYSLEKAVAYFAQTMTGEQQVAAKKIAEVVELVHIGSENNRVNETRGHLDEYLKLAEEFSSGL